MKKYPIYIVSKGRSDNAVTMRALTNMGVPFRIVVEAQEFDLYANRYGAENLLILPQTFLDEYDTCDAVVGRSKGPGSARNFAWDHAMAKGYAWHWVLDDNLENFHRLNRNKKVRVKGDATFAAAEDFVNRYTNVAIAGFNYYSFAKAADPVPPFVLNTRIYSCLLIRNDIPYRWRGRYNEDTDLSLRVLKDGYCTVQFNAFLCGKVTTQRMKGGNTKEFYAEEGTKPKSQMLADLHPDVASVVWRFNRWHHHVDYSSFRSNKLIFKPDHCPKEGINEYGMKLVHEQRDLEGI